MGDDYDESGYGMTGRSKRLLILAVFLIGMATAFLLSGHYRAAATFGCGSLIAAFLATDEREQVRR